VRPIATFPGVREKLYLVQWIHATALPPIK
jgi:hypothetical protein